MQMSHIRQTMAGRVVANKITNPISYALFRSQEDHCPAMGNSAVVQLGTFELELHRAVTLRPRKFVNNKGSSRREGGSGKYCLCKCTLSKPHWSQVGSNLKEPAEHPTNNPNKLQINKENTHTAPAEHLQHTEGSNQVKHNLCLPTTFDVWLWAYHHTDKTN